MIRYFLSYRYCTWSLICLHREDEWFGDSEFGKSEVESYPMTSIHMAAVYLCPAFHREQTTADNSSSTTILENGLASGHDCYDGFYTCLLVISRDQGYPPAISQKRIGVHSLVIWSMTSWHLSGLQMAPAWGLCCSHWFSTLLSKVVRQKAKNTTLT